MERKKAVRFGAALAITRLLQWLLAFVSYRFFRQGFSDNARATWDMDAGVNAVPVLVELPDYSYLSDDVRLS